MCRIDFKGENLAATQAIDCAQPLQFAIKACILWLMRAGNLYLTGFLKRGILDKCALNRAFCQANHRKPLPFTISILTILHVTASTVARD
jgi:hypothetical protein